jgi:cation diffusion facilitator family transporter
MKEFDKRQKQTELVVNLGLVCNALLAVVKLVAGIVGHSRALLADGVNSTSDVVYFIVVRIFVAMSGKPADEEHPYGHHQLESIAALIVGAFVLTTGIAIFWDSINSLFDLIVKQETPQSIRLFSLWVACGTILTKMYLMAQARSIGVRVNNPAVMALAKDHRNDIFASAGAGIGILLSIMGYPWFDPVAGAVVAILVAKTGIGIIRDSADELMDSVPSGPLSEQVRQSLAAVPEVLAVEDIRAHRFGPYLVLNVTIGIDGRLSVHEGDAIATAVEKKLSQDIDLLRTVYVHYHPAAGGG